MRGLGKSKPVAICEEENLSGPCNLLLLSDLLHEDAKGLMEVATESLALTSLDNELWVETTHGEPENCS